MTAVRIDGRALAEKVRGQVAEDVRAYGGPVCLATILVGDDPASHTYVGSKHKASHEAGIDSRDHRFPSDTDQDTILELIAELNADDDVDGILVQLPLPDHMDEPIVLRAVDPAKDVDGFHVLNAGRLYLGEPFLVPATPSGVMVMLEEHGVELKGADAVVIGRSEIVGKPMAMLLLAQHATVTICHSRTEDLAAHTRRADVLVAAVGRRGLVTPDMVKPGATVIDVGVNRTEEGKLVGDVDPGVFEVAGLMTPVPGGVWPMTIAMLLRNTLTAAQQRRPRVAAVGS
ncbi:MAG TPA: bifunctional 5,10-methylenetetrahydrofolate dehydrogenase/5,10-methenyltetrahydrofolate cyclohydrolase [Gaiellaceae bacterium]|nr:bifunctional 5,10-methylenetetrahydrofolate dehydrogenase/5,10-methenyltetrahydrofolate cyclohydrolase [Gaiellaceae bacterium]